MNVNTTDLYDVSLLFSVNIYFLLRQTIFKLCQAPLFNILLRAQ